MSNLPHELPATVYRDGTPPPPLTAEQEKLKRDLYDKISPRRRKFIDKIGYENWDPFPKPNDPIEMRQDVTKRTSQDLIREFFQTRSKEDNENNAYRQGALELVLGVINRDDKYLGALDFAIWYHELLKREGLLEPEN
ncbi:MAG: hypothetical protein J5855_01575 [Mailhella sp.]|nr:hypothetical protein [Mailhella sp.]